jgi:hypothetical protein
MPNPRMTIEQETAAYADVVTQAASFPALHLLLHFNHGIESTSYAFSTMVRQTYLNPVLPPNL